MHCLAPTRWPGSLLPRFGLLALVITTTLPVPAALAGHDPLTGPRTRVSKDWVGTRTLPPGTPVLVLAGHADSQGIAGAGTPGEAVALFGAAPMQAEIRDELFWNLAVAQEVARLGQQRGLAIGFYDPPLRTIANGDDPRTNWSVGREHVRRGGYAVEIHFDAYGPDGFGSGLIPPLQQPLSRLDEALAGAFGGFPARFRQGLGAPRRGIAILEIGKLEGPLEAALRDPYRRQATLEAIAARVVQAIETGLTPSPGGPGTAPLSPQPVGVGSVPPAMDR
jgi:hypothetical protein